jgi:hypothetical protein
MTFISRKILQSKLEYLSRPIDFLIPSLKLSKSNEIVLIVTKISKIFNTFLKYFSCLLYPFIFILELSDSNIIKIFWMSF